MVGMMGLNLLFQEFALVTEGKVNPQIRALGDALRVIGDFGFITALTGLGIGPGLALSLIHI